MPDTAQVAEPQSAPSDPLDAIAELLVEEDDASTGTEEPQIEATEAPQTEDEAPEPEAAEAEPEDSQVAEPEAASEENESLANLLGLDDDQMTVDDDGNISFKVKVNGEEAEVSLEDMRTGFQFDRANQMKAKALAEEKKAFETARQETKARVEQAVTHAEAFAMMQHKRLMSEYDGTNWEELRQFNPGEYAAKQEEYRQHQTRLQAEFQETVQYVENWRAQQESEAQAKREAERQAKLEENWELMLNNNPKWRDEIVFDREMGALRGFVQKQYGFSEEDTRIVSDARLIELIKDAAAFRTGKSIQSKKTAPKAPKVQRSSDGRFQSKAQSKRDKLVKAAKAAKGANRRTLQTDAIADLLLNGD